MWWIGGPNHPTNQFVTLGPYLKFLVMIVYRFFFDLWVLFSLDVDVFFFFFLIDFTMFISFFYLTIIFLT